MFKKKGRPTGAISKASSDSTLPNPDSATPDELDDNISETLEELIALRKLKRATGGIDLERLNAGEKRKATKSKAPVDGVVGADGMIEGTQGGIKDRVRDVEEDANDPNSITRRLVKSNNFTGQTNAVDVDKHMMAYIEEELKKRKGTTEPIDTEKEIQSLDPRDELYQIAEKYKIAKPQVDDDEGSVTLSAAMLTAIPEVDLGIDRKLKNIEDTEKAKRQLFEAKQNAAAEEDEFAADRFYRARRPLESDADALAKARREAAGEQTEQKKAVGAGRREMATDDKTMERFKKRQRK